MYNQFDAIMRDIGVQSVSNREIVADAFGGIKAALRIEDIKN
jgi:hypothetical protein